MSKHTPKPWIRNGSVVRDAGGDRKVADVRISNDEGIANAKLIVAAPELLESLSNLVGLARLGAANLSKYHAALADAEAAIAKATAQSQTLEVATSDWIKCSDRLPPIRQKVLVYRLGKKTNDGPFFAMTCGNEHRPWRYIDGDRCDITPTHWHEIPAPPSE